MLNKNIIMTLVIWNIKMIFHQRLKIRVMRIRIWVSHPTNVHKNGDLITMLVHTLHFILDFKTIISSKINYWDHYVNYKVLKTGFELNILPSGHKIMANKVLKLRLEIIDELNIACDLTNKFQFIFLSSPFFVTIVSKKKSLQLTKQLEVPSSSIRKMSTPQLSHSPNKHSLACHFENSSWGQTTNSHSTVNPKYAACEPMQIFVSIILDW